MAAPGGQAGEIDKLKALLFSPESSRLATAEAHIDALEGRVGDAPRLEAATAEILVEALRRAEVARHRELAAAIAPVVVAAIRNEIKNSRDMMVEALYPITGRLVAAAVANAFRELAESINRRLDSLLSTSHWKLRLQSLTSGRPMAEIALSQAASATFQRILLLERGSGILLAHWSAGAAHADNPEMISGMIAAISEFATSVLASQHGELRTLDLGGSQVFLRASSQIVLAAEVTGDLDRGDRQALDAGFLDLVDRHDRGVAISEADLAALATGRSVVGAGAGKSKLGIAALIVALLVALALFFPIRRWQREAAINGALEQARAANPGLNAYPLRLDIDHSAGKVVLQGLTGSAQDAAAAISAVTAAAAPYDVAPAIAVVASDAQLQASATLANALAARINQAEHRIDAAMADMRAASNAAQAAQAAGLTRLAGNLNADIAAQTAAVGTLAADIKATKDSLVQSEALNLGALATKSQQIEALAGDIKRLTADDAAAQAAQASSLDQLRDEMRADLAGKSQQLGALAGDIKRLTGDDAAAQAAQASNLDRLRDEVRAGLASKDVAIEAAKQTADQRAQDNAAKIEALRADVESAREAATARLTQAEQLGADSAARIGPLAATLDAIRTQIPAPTKPSPSPHEQFLNAIAGVAIFFTAQDDFVNPETASSRLDAIAAAMKQSGDGIRVVGYADDTGGAVLNATNSNKRAAKIARLLIERGVAAEKIVAVARSAQMQIADAASSQHARNRRVMFEALLSDELPP